MMPLPVMCCHFPTWRELSQVSAVAAVFVHKEMQVVTPKHH